MGWRKLHPDQNIFSGQFFSSGKVRLTAGDRTKRLQGYIPFVEFDFVTYYPASEGRWDEHYLGEKDGVYIALYVKHASRTEGPRI